MLSCSIFVHAETFGIWFKAKADNYEKHTFLARRFLHSSIYILSVACNHKKWGAGNHVSRRDGLMIYNDVQIYKENSASDSGRGFGM